MFFKVSGQLTPEENPPNPLLRVGVSVKVWVSFKVENNQKIAPEKNWPLVRVRVWVAVSFGVGGEGGNFPPGQLS